MYSTIYSLSNEYIKLPVVIKVQAKQSKVLGIINGRLKIAIAATPVDGKANKELIRFISKLFDLTKQAVILNQGVTSSFKLLYLPFKAQNKLDHVLSQFKINIDNLE